MLELQQAASLLDWMYRWMPDWLIALAILAFAVGLALLAHRLLVHLLQRVTAGKDMFWRSLVSRLTGRFNGHSS